MILDVYISRAQLIREIYFCFSLLFSLISSALGINMQHAVSSNVIFIRLIGWCVRSTTWLRWKECSQAFQMLLKLHMHIPLVCCSLNLRIVHCMDVSTKVLKYEYQVVSFVVQYIWWNYALNMVELCFKILAQHIPLFNLGYKIIYLGLFSSGTYTCYSRTFLVAE